MPFETTDIAAKTNSQPFDAVKTMSGLADLNNAQNQNKFFQAKNLAGQYLEHSLGPDGQPDFEKLAQFLVNDKRTGPFATELMQAAKSFQNTGVSTQQMQQSIAASKVSMQQAQQTLAANKYNAARGVAASAGNTSQNPNEAVRDLENSKAAVSALIAAQDSGMFDPETIAQVLGSGDFTPKAIRAATLAGAGGAGTLEAAVGKPMAVNRGPTTDIINVNPALGQASSMQGNAASLKMDLPPEVVNTPAYNDIDPVTNQPRVITRGVAAKNPPKGPVVSGYAPGVQAAAETAGAESSKQFKAAELDSTAAQARLLSLKNALQSLKGTTTGPGTKEVNSVKAFLLAQGGDLAKFLPGVDAKQIADWTEAHKYMNTYWLNKANSLGPLTGEKLAAALSANASTDLTNLPNEDLIKVNMALERMQIAGLAAFQATKRPGEDYSDFMSSWSRQVDPRAFMLDQLTSKERAAMTKKMTPTEITQFQNGVKDAVQLGIYTRKDWPK